MRMLSIQQSSRTHLFRLLAVTNILLDGNQAFLDFSVFSFWFRFHPQMLVRSIFVPQKSMRVDSNFNSFLNTVTVKWYFHAPSHKNLHRNVVYWPLSVRHPACNFAKVKIWELGECTVLRFAWLKKTPTQLNDNFKNFHASAALNICMVFREFHTSPVAYWSQ